jgi:hypothetical protein
VPTASVVPMARRALFLGQPSFIENFREGCSPAGRDHVGSGRPVALDESADGHGSHRPREDIDLGVVFDSASPTPSLRKHFAIVSEVSA